MKRYLILILNFLYFSLSATVINFSNNKYDSAKFLSGLEIKLPSTNLFTDTLFSYPNISPLSADSIFISHKYYLVELYSPYVCENCSNADFEIINSFAKDFPDQVFILTEFWNLRDVDRGLKKIKLNQNVKILLDKKGVNILNLSNLADSFINAGFIILNENLNIKYILMTSYKSPLTNDKIKKLIKNVYKYLSQE